jgi:CheY-like chemotaxis protein
MVLNSDWSKQGTGLIPQELRGKKILVVEDDFECLQLTKLILEMHGAQAVTARSVPEALELFAAHQPDLVLSDICMPDETGYSLVQKIRAFRAEAGGKTPAVAMSGLSEAEDRERILNAGFNHFLPKPYLHEALVGLVQQALRS